jgi:hypothetical protein
MGEGVSSSPEFIRFVKEVEPRLSYAFYPAYGPEVGSEVTEEALIHAWEHWAQIQEMNNPRGTCIGSGRARHGGITVRGPTSLSRRHPLSPT